MLRMSLEQSDHFLRHIKMHAEELKNGTFSKKVKYLDNLKEAQYCAMEVSHDLIHILRYKKFKGYENADFSFDVSLPSNLTGHEFREFDYDSFHAAYRLKNALDIGITEDSLNISVEELENQMENLSAAIQDAGVFIKLLEKYFKPDKKTE